MKPLCNHLETCILKNNCDKHGMLREKTRRGGRFGQSNCAAYEPLVKTQRIIRYNAEALIK